MRLHTAMSVSSRHLPGCPDRQRLGAQSACRGRGSPVMPASFRPEIPGGHVAPTEAAALPLSYNRYSRSGRVRLSHCQAPIAVKPRTAGSVRALRRSCSGEGRHPFRAHRQCGGYPRPPARAEGRITGMMFELGSWQVTQLFRPVATDMLRLVAPRQQRTLGFIKFGLSVAG